MKALVIILLLFGTQLHAAGIKENRVTSKLTIAPDSDQKINFHVHRSSTKGVNKIEIKSSTRNKSYYLKVLEDDKELPTEDAIEFETLGDYKTKITYNSLAKSSYNGDLELLKDEPNSISFNYTAETVIKKVELINKKDPTDSYQLELKVDPIIELDIDRCNTSAELESYLSETQDAKNYLKKAILGRETFIANSDTPFPIVELNNDKIYFDSILTDGNSIIQKLLMLFYNKNKPLFHKYINRYMNLDFNYTEYEKISPGDGEKLVEAALKYLTWGVEHTPKTNYLTLSKDETFPSQLIDESNRLKYWLKLYTKSEDLSIKYIPTIPIDKKNNYLPFISTETNEIKNSNDPSYRPDFQEVNNPLKLTTPFGSLTGASLSYVKGGMDSPRTFNYKMMKQKETIERFFIEHKYLNYGTHDETGYHVNKTLFTINSSGTTINNIFNYYYYYDNETTEINSDEPFLPVKTNNSLYQGKNLTGVDSLGLLSGAIAMTDWYDKILDINNEAKLVKLNNYYSMKDDDIKFKTVTPKSSDNYRLTRLDLEKSTVIVPSLDLLQKGDLIVGNSNSNDIAIVIEANSDIDKILLLSVIKKDERVSLYYWGKNFTNSPKSFTIRRLIKFTKDLTKETPSKYEDEDIWDPFSPNNTDIKYNMEFATDNHHWIANTGELFIINSIKFGHKDENVLTELEYSGIPVKLLLPTDLNLKIDASNNNVYTNKGDGFAFYAISGNMDAVRLATFKPNTIEYNSTIFDNDGNSKNEFSLIYVPKIGLKFSSGLDKKFTRFAVRPLENNKPGDDILLNFSLTIEGKEFKVNGEEDNFLAVYDKKLLWRANLYIDEKGKDWNNKNPWNAPKTKVEADNFGEFKDNNITKRFLNPETWSLSDSEKVWYGPNIWNKPDKDYHGIKGGQITKIKKYINIFGGGQPNSVAYSFPETASTPNARDTPFEFNKKILHQKELMGTEYDICGIKWEDSPMNLPWQDVIPPENKWSNYSRANTACLPGLGLIEYYNENTTLQASKTFIDSIYSGNGSGYGSYTDHTWESRFAGTDCIGFAQNAANYDFYKWNIPKEGNNGTYRVYPRIEEDTYNRWAAYSDLIVGRSNTEKDSINKHYVIIGNLENIRPGDIFYYAYPPNPPIPPDYEPTNQGGGRHIGIVQKVNITPGKTTTSDDITIIENTFAWGNSELAYVLNRNKLTAYNAKHWRIVRLKK